MEYTLAKELKDAGFPQKYGETRLGRWVAPDGSRLGIIHSGDDARSACYLPTLSELIEACGERFDSLVLHEKIANDGGYWEATGDEYFNDTGPTPEEAVARLWLSLNKPTT